MTEAVALLTGFEPYGGGGINPSTEVVKRLDGSRIGGARVIGRVLPASFAALRARAGQLVTELDPTVVVSLGLWPGDPTIRLERMAINLADFEIADNDGLVLRDEPVDGSGPTALASTLPLRQIERALLQAGIPARLSMTAGTFLCNATLYSCLRAADPVRGPACGFVHLPYLPEQAAAMLEAVRTGQRLEPHQRADIASMGLPTMIEAARIVLDVALQEAGARRPA